jgi:hypothetical protein
MSVAARVAESVQAGLDLGEHRGGEPPTEIGAEKRVGFVLVGELWRVLEERGHAVDCMRPKANLLRGFGQERIPEPACELKGAALNFLLLSS